MFGKKEHREINELLNKKFEQKKALIAVHRGAWGGNIIENTTPSCRLALDMGGDMFEVDLLASTDGVVYAYHDGEEKRNLGFEEKIKTMSSETIEKLTYKNCIGLDSNVHIERFESILNNFNNGELFNIDRAWDILPKVRETIKKYPSAIKQMIIKTKVKEEYLEFLDNCEEKFMYMPIVYNMEEVKKVLSYSNINIVGMEIIAKTKDADLFKDENIKYIKDKGLFIWINAISLSGLSSDYLFGGLDDDMALLESEDKAWGKMFEKGANILQTDWPLQCSRYRDKYFS